MALLSGLQADSDQYAAAYLSNVANRYGGQEGTYDVEFANEASRRWMERNSLIRDDTLVAQGFDFYRGDPSTNEADMRAAGYITNAEAGGIGGNTSSGWYKATTPAAVAPVVDASQTSSSGGGASTQSIAPVAATPTPDPIPEPEVFRSNVKTGTEVGSDFKLFKGGELGNKAGLTADQLRIGGAAPKASTRDINKKKQLNTLGLNINTPGIGLGI